MQIFELSSVTYRKCHDTGNLHVEDRVTDQYVNNWLEDDNMSRKRALQIISAAVILYIIIM